MHKTRQLVCENHHQKTTTKDKATEQHYTGTKTGDMGPLWQNKLALKKSKIKQVSTLRKLNTAITQ